MSTSKKYNQAVSELQYASHQHTLHLTTIQTLTTLYQAAKGSPLESQIEQALSVLLQPFLPKSPIEHDING